MDHVLLAALVMTVTTALCAALVPPSRALARHFGVIDEPGHRKVHGQPMPTRLAAQPCRVCGQPLAAVLTDRGTHLLCHTPRRAQHSTHGTAA